MDSVPRLSAAELNAAALEHFIYQPVDKDMIRYLARAASQVIQCDPSMMPPAQLSQKSQRAVKSNDSNLPTIEEFITQLVVSSNVQVPTLMSTLVYLRRLKSRLQPMAKGLRCTTHRIFLAALILSAKYLNDSSPKNKHWATYSTTTTSNLPSFGFSRTEVNLMEKQLLFLLDWDLRISESDLYRDLDPFLAPLRTDIEARYLRRWRRKHEQDLRERQLAEERMARQREREEEARLWASLAQPVIVNPPITTTTTRSTSQDRAYPSRGTSRDASRSRSRQANAYPHAHSRSRGSSRDVSPPGLYHSSNSSYAGSTTTSRATTPMSEVDITTAAGGYYYGQEYQAQEPAVYDPMEYESPMEIGYQAECAPKVPEKDAMYAGAGYGKRGRGCCLMRFRRCRSRRWCRRRGKG
ncbi:PHO85 cyclin-1 [Collariella sp. IMI 366227]|nr:PHO85 cyclin-1 [Collariella sp. IMI 366227]